MHGKTRRRWNRLIKMHKESGLSIKEFSRKIGVHYSQFYRQYKAIKEKSFGKEKRIRKVETTVSSHMPMKVSSDLFIELQSDAKAFQPTKTSGLKITYRELTFELAEDFNTELFKRALFAVREAL